MTTLAAVRPTSPVLEQNYALIEALTEEASRHAPTSGVSLRPPPRLPVLTGQPRRYQEDHQRSSRRTPGSTARRSPAGVGIVGRPGDRQYRSRAVTTASIQRRRGAGRQHRSRQLPQGAPAVRGGMSHSAGSGYGVSTPPVGREWPADSWLRQGVSEAARVMGARRRPDHRQPVGVAGGTHRHRRESADDR